MFAKCVIRVMFVYMIWLFCIFGISSENVLANVTSNKTDTTVTTLMDQTSVYTTEADPRNLTLLDTDSTTKSDFRVNKTLNYNDNSTVHDPNVTLSYNAFDVSSASKKFEGSENFLFAKDDYTKFGLRETAGFVAIGFLAFAIVGYVGFVLWRRYLQNKYGNGQTLITEDVYDISDLRHFEI